ncbi:MAG: phosphoribosylanthranilate isomerase [Planctomycetota bacterium]
MARTRIKVCGVRDVEAIDACAEAGVDAIGLMLIERSPRYIQPEDAFELSGVLPPFMSAVAVVADLSVDQFNDMEQRCPAPLVQLHGSESEKTVQSCGPGVVKAFRYEDATIATQLPRWNAIDEVDAILVDGSAGGEGKSFEWGRLAEAIDAMDQTPGGPLLKPLIVAGGLTPETVGDAIRSLRPYAVDVSSGVESEPGVKDPVRIRAFAEAVAQADSA